MNRFALAAVAALSFAIAAPAVSSAAPVSQDRIQLAQADVKVKVKSERPAMRKKVVIKRTMHRDRRASMRHGTVKKVVISRGHHDRGRHNGVVIKKKTVVRG
jgi:hypothetical protein